jgi:hypothetical protein
MNPHTPRRPGPPIDRAEAIAAHFEGKRTKKRLEEMMKLLETLAAVGRARGTKAGWLGT